VKAYIDAKYLGREYFNKLKDDFLEVDFLSDEDDLIDCEVIVAMMRFFSEHDLDEFPKLKWIQLLMAGYDKFDLAKAKAKGILFSTAQDVFSISIAEDVLAKILFFNRNIKHYLEMMDLKKWDPIPRETEIFQSTIGILGAGSIAKELASRFRAFQTKILCYRKQHQKAAFADETYWDQVGLQKLLEQSDYVIVCLSLTEETTHLLDWDTLSRMKSSAILINVARGGIINQEALIKILKEKKIRGAGLDVTTPEPLDPNSELWEMPNVYITPHNASSSIRMRERLYELTRDNLRRYLSNRTIKYLV
jgi:phosphoglycerate dehydrogenase-like enzyme